MPASESEFFTGVKTFKVSKEELDKFYEEKNNIILTEEEEKGLYPNQFIVFESNETDAKIAGRFLKPGKPLKFVSFQQSAWNIKNKNMEQAFLMDLLMDDSVSLVTVNSRSGAGKTLISLACALELTLTKRKYNKILITRNIQPLGKDIGALPGTTEEKLSPWIAPFKDNLEFLLNENIDDAVAKGAVKSKKSENLKHSFGMQDLFERGIIQIEATTFIRGRSIPKCIFLVDESQNLSLHEMKTILTRVGEGTKIVLLGDYNQIDSTYLNKFTNGLTIATEKFKNEEVAGHVTLVKGERSKLATIASDIL
jgi:PhoH-like ATPase